MSILTNPLFYGIFKPQTKDTILSGGSVWNQDRHGKNNFAWRDCASRMRNMSASITVTQVTVQRMRGSSLRCTAVPISVRPAFICISTRNKRVSSIFPRAHSITSSGPVHRRSNMSFSASPRAATTPKISSGMKCSALKMQI